MLIAIFLVYPLCPQSAPSLVSAGKRIWLFHQNNGNRVLQWHELAFAI